ncbi:MAG: PKD domain-containing protein [Bacteroidales bacterium]
MLDKKPYLIGLITVLIFMFVISSVTANVDMNAITEEYPGNNDEIMLDINMIYTEYVCYGETGMVRVFIQQGTPPYDFQWNTGDTSQDIYDVPAGTYSVTVTDGLGDVVENTVTIEELPDLDSVFNAGITHVDCNGMATGEIVTDFDTITGPYNYVWSHGANSPSVSNLPADTFSVTITDAHGCQMDTTIEITEPDTILTSVSTEAASCYGAMDGMAWVDVTGGVPVDTTSQGFVYNYHWPDPTVDDDTLQYYGGTYTLTVSDANGCSVTELFTIDQPSQIIAMQAGNPDICIGGQTTLSTQVTGGSPPYTYNWINASTNDTTFSSSVTVSPDQTTSYYFIATDQNGCTSNTVWSTVNVYPELMVTSLVTSDDSICPGDPLEVEFEIEGGNGGPYEVRLANTNEIVTSPLTLYPEESKEYTLKIKDQCTTPEIETSFSVTVMPLPPAAFIVDKYKSCPPGEFEFSELSPDQGQSYYWDFGDDDFSYEKSPTHTYTESGVYDVKMTASTPFGCEKTVLKEDLITVFQNPDADFYANRNNASILEPNIQFFNISTNADSIYWYFGDGDSSLNSVQNPWHTYQDVGYYTVRMKAENIHGCVDTAYKKIRIKDEHKFYAPEAFSPDRDGENDCFRVCGHGIDTQSFEFYVYDRYGSKVYETTHFKNDQDCSRCGEGSWDGTYNGSLEKGDKVCKSGLYFWYCKYKDFAGVERAHEGKVTLIR